MSQLQLFVFQCLLNLLITSRPLPHQKQPWSPKSFTRMCRTCIGAYPGRPYLERKMGSPFLHAGTKHVQPAEDPSSSAWVFPHQKWAKNARICTWRMGKLLEEKALWGKIVGWGSESLYQEVTRAQPMGVDDNQWVLISTNGCWWQNASCFIRLPCGNWLADQ